MPENRRMFLVELVTGTAAVLGVSFELSRLFGNFRGRGEHDDKVDNNLEPEYTADPSILASHIYKHPEYAMHLMLAWQAGMKSGEYVDSSHLPQIMVVLKDTWVPPTIVNTRSAVPWQRNGQQLRLSLMNNSNTGGYYVHTDLSNWNNPNIAPINWLASEAVMQTMKDQISSVIIENSRATVDQDVSSLEEILDLVRPLAVSEETIEYLRKSLSRYMGSGNDGNYHVIFGIRYTHGNEQAAITYKVFRNGTTPGSDEISGLVANSKSERGG